MRPSRKSIAAAHLASSTRGARLLAASGGDAEHAARIDAALSERGLEASPAEVIRLPVGPYDRALDDELELEAVANVLGWWPAMLLGLAGWLLIAGAAWTIYALARVA